ncbi:pheT, partial [Acrasis kona]
LTDGGRIIESVIGTHSFHTTHFEAFHKSYPDADYYGTPRHLKNIKKIDWKGDLSDPSTRRKWNPDVEIRITEGSEFINPYPSNRLSSAWVFHKPSKTIHINDTVMYAEDPGFLFRMIGVKKQKMTIHPSIHGYGLKDHPEAPFEFRDFVNKAIIDWDFDNMVMAHVDNKLGGAKELLKETVEEYEPVFKRLHTIKKMIQ